jgi:hypothetical protein
MTMKKMFKVLCPMEGRNGNKWWMRLGTGFPNKDESINIYLDAIPTHAGFTLQLREVTEEDMRQNAERRAAFPPRANVAAGHAGVRHEGGARADASFDPSVFEQQAFTSNPSTPF